MIWIAIPLIVFSLIALVFPLIPSNNWAFNAFTYPRIQIIYIQLITTILMLFVWGWQIWTLVLATLFFSNIVLILRIIRPYTSYGEKQLLDYEEDTTVTARLSLLVWNVYQFNKQIQSFIELVKEEQPDIILLCETNEWWTGQLEEVRKSYPHHKEIPLENTYGMCLYSRYPFEQVEVQRLLREDVPSIHATIVLDDGQKISIFGVHPIPPYPLYSESKAPKDAELLLIAKKVRSSSHPCIVLGDMNDVAWSNLTTTFQKISRLLDPRRGRGIIPTFHAKMPLMRIPIDQIFCSADFLLDKMERMPAMGSDHFPLLAKLVLSKKVEEEQTLDMQQPNQADWEHSKEQIEEGRAFVPQTS